MTTEEREALRDFIVAVVRAEVRAAVAIVKGEPGQPGAPGARGSDGEPGPRGEPGVAGEKGELGDRGPQGERGEPGTQGKDGRDGRDGIAILTDEVRGEVARAVATLRAELEPTLTKHVADVVASLPTLQYRGVFQEGTQYRAGECVTWAGSVWHAKEATTEKPGDGETAWQLMVKKGRDGREVVAR